MSRSMDDSLTLEEQDASVLMQASSDPFLHDNTTVCKCKVSRRMCVREKGRNACPCKNIGHFCSSVCHGQDTQAAEQCLNQLKVLDGDCTSSSEASLELESPGEEFVPSHKQSKSQSKGSGRKVKVTGRSRAVRGSGRRQATSAAASRGSARRGRGRLIAEAHSEERLFTHGDQVKELVNSLDEGAVRHLAVELLRRQPATFADLVNGQLPNINARPQLPSRGGDGPPSSDEPPPPHGHNSPDWCKCGLCVVMPTQAENKCCTKSVRPCITTNPLFYQIVLDGNILDIAMRYREDMLAMEHPRNNDNFRHTAYRQFVLWQHGRLGQSNRMVVPSCCVNAIRNRYPSPNGVYVGFRPTRL